MATTRRRRTHVHLIATAIRAVTAVFVGILVLHILLVLLEANPGNSLVQHISNWAGDISGWSKDLFTPDSYKARVFVNEGLAAVVYALVGGALSRASTRL